MDTEGFEQLVMEQIDFIFMIESVDSHCAKKGNEFAKRWIMVDTTI